MNAIAEECSFEVDLRSEDPGTLDKIEVKLLEAVRVGTAEENKARAESSPLVQAALQAAKATGFEPQTGYSSTDANLPISLGIPAVTLGGGGISGNAHSLNEYYEPEGAWKGPQMVMLTVLGFDSGRQ